MIVLVSMKFDIDLFCFKIFGFLSVDLVRMIALERIVAVIRLRYIRGPSDLVRNWLIRR